MTTGQTIAAAINNDTTFTASASQATAASSTFGYAAGTDTRTNATTSVNTADGGSLVVSSLISGTDTDKVQFAENATTPVGAPTVALSTTSPGGILTVTVNSNGKTSLAAIASAINNFAEASGINPFSATVASAGNFNTAADLTTGIAPDGTAAATAANGEVTITGAKAGTLAIDSAGALDNGAQVLVTKSASGTSSAVWNAAAAGGKGQLTLSLANGTYTAASLNTLLSNATTPSGAAVALPFSADTVIATNFVVGGGAGTDDLGSGPVTGTIGGTTAGTTGVTNAVVQQTLTGGSGTSTGELSGGTGTAGLLANLVLQVGGNAGGQLFTFTTGTTAAQMATALNQASEATGVQAMAIGDQLVFNSTGYGSAANASVQVVNEGTGGNFGSSLSAANAAGSDIQATVNGVTATGQGNTVTLNTPSLGFSADLDPTQINAGENVDFNVTGGGALFQLGPVVTSTQQVNLGIHSVTTSLLGRHGRPLVSDRLGQQCLADRQSDISRPDRSGGTEQRDLAPRPTRRLPNGHDRQQHLDLDQCRHQSHRGPERHPGRRLRLRKRKASRSSKSSCNRARPCWESPTRIPRTSSRSCRRPRRSDPKTWLAA